MQKITNQKIYPKRAFYSDPGVRSLWGKRFTPEYCTLLKWGNV